MPIEFPSAALEFARQLRACVLATCEGGQPWCRVMWVTEADDDFTLYYATFTSSNKARQLAANPLVCASFYGGGRDLRVFGRGEILSDSASKQRIWREEYRRYFKGGIDDPEFCVLKLSADRVVYEELRPA